MASRTEAPDSLDYFPTPPWATRALMECVLPKKVWQNKSAWEPACGEGHMAEVLKDYFHHVRCSDVHDYRKGYAVGSFVGEGLDVAGCESGQEPDWVITNPPFNLACEFAERAIHIARVGVALLVRTTWLESRDRYDRLFRNTPPNFVGLFTERVPMVKGRWDPAASTATSYAWVVWDRIARLPECSLVWIPPGQRRALTRPTDAERFAA